jgi:hypothetical protein
MIEHGPPDGEPSRLVRMLGTGEGVQPIALLEELPIVLQLIPPSNIDSGREKRLKLKE